MTNVLKTGKAIGNLDSKPKPNPRRRRKDSVANYNYGTLEDRRLLAFGAMFDGSTLILDQTFNDGAVVVDNDGAGGAFRVSDLSGTDTFAAATNVVINLMDGVSPLNLNINHEHAGNVEIAAGDGVRSIAFTGTDNRIGGDLTVVAGAEGQTLTFSQLTTLQVGGTIDVDTGFGNDAWTSHHGIHASGDLNMNGVDRFQVDSGGIVIGGDVSFTSLNEPQFSSFEKLNADGSSIGGDFNLIGSSIVNQLQLTELVVFGDLNLDFGEGLSLAGESQILLLDQVEFNNLNLTSGDTTNADIVAFSDVTANGDIAIDLGAGNNSSILMGTINGSSFSYVGTSDVDYLAYGMTGGGGHSVSASLGDAIDTFVLLDGSTINNLSVDFGLGLDDFVNPYGQFTFDAQLNSLVAFHHTYDLATDTLTSDETQLLFVAATWIRTDPVTQSVIAMGNSITPATNLEINLHDGFESSIEIGLEHELAGDLTVDLASGNRSIVFSGNSNRVSGDVAITGQEGATTLDLSDTNQFVVGGELIVDLGTNSDTVDSTQGVDVAGKFVLKNVNDFFNDSQINVGGNFVFDVSMDTDDGILKESGELRVAGDMLIFGGTRRDRIAFNATVATTIDGDFFASLGDETTGMAQSVNLNDKTTVMGDVTVLSTNEFSPDIFLTVPGSEIGGNTFVNLGGGENAGLFIYKNGGETATYVGGSGADTVNFDTTGGLINPNIVLGEGDDSLTLEAGVQINNKLRVDFGGGVDSFNNNFGAFNIDTSLLNWNSASSYYNAANDSLTIVQVADLGSTGIVYDVAGGAIRFTNEFLPNIEITPASNVAVYLLPGTNSHDVRLEVKLAGNLILNLNHGDRDLIFSGFANEIGGELVIEGRSGAQNLFVSELSDMSVGGNAIFNLRDGVDTIQDNGHGIGVGGSLILRSVNDYQVDGFVEVKGNMKMVSVWDSDDTRLENHGVFDIQGYFSYLGGDGADEVLLDGGVVGFNTSIDVGASVMPGKVQDVDLSGLISGQGVAVYGGSSINGNNLMTDAATQVGTHMIVNFSVADANTVNTAMLHGVYGGSDGIYIGGNGFDHMTFGADAPAMNFASLLKAGDDFFALEATTNLFGKFINFGDGDDTFVDSHVEDFPVTTVNL